MKIIKATLLHLDELAELFNLYAIFYKQSTNIQACRSFLKDRLTNGEAYIFIAFNNQNEAMGFTLLYPSFSSVRRAKVYTLNDLYVKEKFRNSGVATYLLETAITFGRNEKALGLQLETEATNIKAQKLYEKEGWTKERNFHYVYNL